MITPQKKMRFLKIFIVMEFSHQHVVIIIIYIALYMYMIIFKTVSK